MRVVTNLHTTESVQNSLEHRSGDFSGPLQEGRVGLHVSLRPGGRTGMDDKASPGGARRRQCEDDRCLDQLHAEAQGVRKHQGRMTREMYGSNFLQWV